jgi:tetratricopeptide (TPR) repeat protein
VLGEAAKAEEPGVRGHALHIQGKAALDLGRVEDACEHFAGAVAALSLTPFPTAYAKVDLAAASLHVTRPDTAADVLEEALAELTRAGDEEEASRARFLLARAYRALGQHDQALTLLEQVAERCAEDGNPGGVGQMRTMAGDILDELDRDKLAAEQYTLAAEAWHEADRPLDELVTRRRAAVSWRWAEELDRCLSALATAETLSVTLDAEDPTLAWERAMLAYDAARILADVGQPQDAVSRAADAVTRFRSLAATTEATFATLLHGRLLADLGRPAEAENLLTAALHDLPPDANEPREQVEALLSSIRS